MAATQLAHVYQALVSITTITKTILYKELVEEGDEGRRVRLSTRIPISKFTISIEQ